MEVVVEVPESEMLKELNTVPFFLLLLLWPVLLGAVGRPGGWKKALGLCIRPSARRGQVGKGGNTVSAG